MSLWSLTQDSLLEDEKGKKEDSPSASLKPVGDNPDEELSDDLSKLRKIHCHSTWKNTQDAAYWINFVRAQDKGLRFWQTRSQAEIVHNSVPTDCIDKVIPQKGERTLFERLSTPRPAPKIVIKSAWQSQQQQQPHQQQQDSESGCTRTRKLVRRVQREEREDQWNTKENPEPWRERKLERSTESLVKKRKAWIQSRNQNWRSCTKM